MKEKLVIIALQYGIVLPVLLLGVLGAWAILLAFLVSAIKYFAGL